MFLEINNTEVEKWDREEKKAKKSIIIEQVIK